MPKKRSDKNSVSSKKAQVTIFIIVGIVILFVSLTLMVLVNKAQKTQFEGELEKIMTRIFQKEGLRLYVEDCLNDGLEEALILIGKQGRLWRDQAGGITFFGEGTTGTRLEGETDEKGARVFYGITNEFSLGQFPEAYPCDSKEDDPVFCKYKYPNITVGFGSKPLLTTDLLSRDLKRYLINRTLICVENFTRTNISTKAEIKTREIKLDLDLSQEGIGVKVDYPITFGLGREEFFALSTFDFFYPTQFYTYIIKNIISPLRWDQQFVDFAYDRTNLDRDYFSYTQKSEGNNCQLTEEGVYSCPRTLSAYPLPLPYSLEKKEIREGDDLFIFSVPGKDIIKGMNKNFTFRIARQNRPPALDYISRCPTEEYDFLVVKDVEGKLSGTFFTPFAVDADEDEMEFTIDGEACQPGENDKTICSFGIASSETETFIVNASDGNLGDWQRVRVKIDDRYQPNVQFKNVLEKEGEILPLSLEDPICVLKGNSASDLQAAEPRFVFFLNGKKIDLAQAENGLATARGNIINNCDLESYDILTLNRVLNQFFPALEDNTLDVEGQVTYSDDQECSYNIGSIPIPNKFVACLDYQHEEFPNPYIPGQKFHQINNQGEIIEEVNPFQATNHCCFEGIIAAVGEPCYQDLEVGCHGPKEIGGGVILNRRTFTCDGIRGNICGGEILYENVTAEGEPLPSGSFPICGGDQEDHEKFKQVCDFSRILSPCRGKPAYSKIEGGYCFGEFGCEERCETSLYKDPFSGKVKCKKMDLSS